MLAFVKNHSNQQKVDIMRIPNWLRQVYMVHKIPPGSLYEIYAEDMIYHKIN